MKPVTVLQTANSCPDQKNIIKQISLISFVSKASSAYLPSSANGCLYEFHTDVYVSVWDAQAKCAETGGVMASIETAAEWAGVRDIMTKCELKDGT